MIIQAKYNLTLLVVLLLAALALVLFVRPVFSQSAVSGLCYSTDGRTVTTTYLGGDPYPVPVSAEIQVVPGGWEVTYRALFRRMRVWLPMIGGTSGS